MKTFHQILSLSFEDFTPTHRIVKFGHPNPLRKSPIHYKLDVVENTDFYTLIFTSGTTSTPKAVCLTHKNFIATAETMQRTCLLNGDYAV